MSTAPINSEVTSNYSLLPSDNSTAKKTGQVFHNQQSEITKHETPQSLKSKADEAYNNKNYQSAYFYYSQAKVKCEQHQKNEEDLKLLVNLHYDLAWTAQQIRHARRSIVKDCSQPINFICLPCWIFCCIQLKDSDWVENGTFRLHIDQGISLLKGFIKTIEENNKITMSTQKNDVQENIRKTLGWACSKLADFYDISEVTNPHTRCFGNADNCSSSDCCFEGDNGKVNMSRYNPATRLHYLGLAKEWDPTNPTYSTEYQALDSRMKTPVIFAHHVTQS